MLMPGQAAPYVSTAICGSVFQARLSGLVPPPLEVKSPLGSVAGLSGLAPGVSMLSEAMQSCGKETCQTVSVAFDWPRGPGAAGGAWHFPGAALTTVLCRHSNIQRYMNNRQGIDGLFHLITRCL
jgi:hypothetical protein